MSDNPTPNGIPERLIEATIALLAEQGPSAIKARTVAAEAGMSTMVVYNYFGGIPELIGAAVEHGFAEIESTLAGLPVTNDPIADLFRMALAVRDIARANPHLYDAMFGLSTRATYRPASANDARRSGHSPTFKAAYAHIVGACTRIAEADRFEATDPDALASSLWSFVHGYITLELADHFVEFDDPVVQVLVPMGVTFTVGLGDDRERARASHETALTSHRSATHSPDSTHERDD
ncbi:WHG domain-containing protein [Saccharopolyspora sp. NPDC049357]|uniref:TetR/AcrR family transcriptional regulator n=1 Tax=Saccharopolyspora sp. NPDC049357 TaxID=3154507 RepID=UPI0034420A73